MFRRYKRIAQKQTKPSMLMLFLLLLYPWFFCCFCLPCFANIALGIDGSGLDNSPTDLHLWSEHFGCPHKVLAKIRQQTTSVNIKKASREAGIPQISRCVEGKLMLITQHYSGWYISVVADQYLVLPCIHEHLNQTHIVCVHGQVVYKGFRKLLQNEKMQV